jgi:multimeric flavodoxin WrbA
MFPVFNSVSISDDKENQMKIVSVLGSPRKNANSSMIANRFCATAQEFGAEVETFVLNDLEFRGCQGCMLCKTKLDRCALQDDLTEVLEAIRETDVLVLASPVYYWDVSGQLKCFLDRTFSYLVPDFYANPVKSRLVPGKKLVLVLVQANPDETMFANIFPKFDYFFRSYGFSDTHLIRACGVGAPGEVENRLDEMTLAEKTAEKLCGS